MACTGTNNPCWIAGDSIYYPITYTNADGSAKDLTGATARMDLRDPVTNATVVQIMSGGITSAIEGKILFTLTKAQSAALLPRAQSSATFTFSVKLEFADTTEQTILTGLISLEQVATE